MSYNNVTLSANSDHLVIGGFHSGSTAISQQAIITDGTGLVYQYSNPHSFALQGETQGTSKRKRIGPKLYFSYVKSKLTKTQVKKLKVRLQKLQALVNSTKEVGQNAAYETFSKLLVVAVRESEAAACGYDVYVNQADVDKFRYQVTENEKSYNNPVRFDKLAEFPRALPAKIQKKVKEVQTKGLFDELYVLSLDYSNEKVKSTKEKIREKDPILFGKFNYDDQRLYFIADWVDEYCDLTLSKFVDELKQKDETYETSSVEDLTPEYLERIKAEIKEREDRLHNVNMSNFREKMAQEDQAEIKRLRTEAATAREKWREEAKQELLEYTRQAAEKEAAKKPWYKKLF